MQLSVIILNYNVRYFLQQCIQSVQQAIKGLDAEIIVVDNNSPDDSCRIVKDYFPDVILIENKENTGFPKGNNTGVAVAKGKYLCILNPDTVVAEDTFTKLLEFTKNQVNPGITGVKLIDGTGNFLPESKRGVPTPWVAMTKIAGLYKLFPKSGIFNRYYACHLDKNQSGPTDILVGAFMFMERSLYNEVGGFDEDCFMYSDDIDLSYMVLKSGRENYYFAGTTMIHYKGESTVKDGTYMKRFREAMQFFYKKHFKSAVFFDVLMRGGAVLFTLAKKNKKEITRTRNKYIVITSDNTLRQQLQEKFQRDVIAVKCDNDGVFLESLQCDDTTEVIFDNDYISYTRIIDIMQKNSTGGLTFKIKPAGTNYIIGSNCSSDRGEVIVLHEKNMQQANQIAVAN